MKKRGAIVYLLFFSFFVDITCSCKLKSSGSEIRCVNIADSIIGYSPIKGTPPSILNFNHNIYYYKDMILYRYFYNATMYFENELISSEQRICYTVHQKDSLYGWYYDSYAFNEKNEDRRVNIDSIHKRPDNKAYDTLLSLKPDSSYWNTDHTLYFELYNLRETDPPGSYLLAYSPAMRNLPVSFSTKLDSAKNMKLIKAKVVVNEGYSKKYNSIVPHMEQTRRMKEIPVENRKEILYYFNKYKREQLKKI